MATSESMFLFEFVLSKVRNRTRCRRLLVLAQFVDAFRLALNDPGGRARAAPRRARAACAPATVQSGQSVLLARNVKKLYNDMKNSPIVITLLNREDTSESLGSIEVKWPETFLEYMRQSKATKGRTVCASEEHKFYSAGSKCVARMVLSMKLQRIVENIPKHRALHHSVTCSDRHEPAYIYQSQNSNFNAQRSSHCLENLESVHINDCDVKQTENVHTTNKPVRCVTKNVNNIFYDPKNRRGIVQTRSHNAVDNKKDRKFNTRSESSIWTNMSSIDKHATKGPVYVCYQSQVTGGFGKEQSVSKELKPIQRENKEPMKGCLEKTKDDNMEDCYETANIIKCTGRRERHASTPPEPCILIQFDEEAVKAQLTANAQPGALPCECTCECKFDYIRKTTYCKLCRGYEKPGEEWTPQMSDFPCPIFHKLLDKKPGSIGDIKKTESGQRSPKSSKGSKGSKGGSQEKTDRSVEGDKKKDKDKEKEVDNRFKFNYGYKAPKIGHMNCTITCGALDGVPRNMGWLWDSDDVPGLKFRPNWRPGAINKSVWKMLREAKYPGVALQKKKRKDASKKKKNDKRPLLVVHKKDGEFEVTMENLKSFNDKERSPNQYPYEDKPVITYVVGRTEEENRMRKKKRERQGRRLEREQRAFIQSAFQDLCDEICRKTYQQALGLLPDAEDPDCRCFPALPEAAEMGLDNSCSCSEDKFLTSGSETDSDEWIVEFTPPSAKYDPKFKSKKPVVSDASSQYTYLDYRVKLLDRQGNPVPRFFKKQDGKEECSDLGGFWSNDKQWLEINVDGYIGPDCRWVPMYFSGPAGEPVDAEPGKFQTLNGEWLVIGVDGYVDINGKWKFYPQSKKKMTTKKPNAKPIDIKGKGADKNAPQPNTVPPKEDVLFSCFRDVSPKQLSERGIVGHGKDKRALLTTLKHMISKGDKVSIPVTSEVPRLGTKRPGGKKRLSFSDRVCHHPVPSSKGVTGQDEFGNTKYYTLRKGPNTRPGERINTLKDRGISLSSFHAPCFQSFLNTEIMKQQIRDRLASRNVASQAQ